MPQYLPEDLDQELTRNQEIVMRKREVYRPALEFLYKREEKFQTEELVDYASSGGLTSVLDDHRAGSFLGVLRDESLIEGGLQEGSYYWDPELKADGSWKDVRKELEELNESGNPKIEG